MIDVMFLNILNIMAYINIKQFNTRSFYNGLYSMIGCIIKDENDNCLFVKNLDLKEYNKTKSESLVKTIEIGDIKNIDYQKP